jgi:meso-butanediol dehydrogenase / (S,S)-butanediol dehydrogenase / diacetyl reductase
MSGQHQRSLVVGGTSGIGRATVRVLREREASVVFTGRNAERGNAVARETGAEFLACDLAVPGAAEAGVGRAIDRLGGLDGLVLSAATIARGPLSETDDATWDEQLAINVLAPLRCAVAALPALRESAGAVVTIASGTAVWADRSLGAYSVTKRCVLWLTQMLAVELGPAGVRVNSVCPGDTSPGMAPGGNDRTAARSPTVPPLGKLADPDEIAEVVLFLLSSASRFCSGANVIVDGGMRAALRAGKAFA